MDSGMNLRKKYLLGEIIDGILKGISEKASRKLLEEGFRKRILFLWEMSEEIPDGNLRRNCWNDG